METTAQGWTVLDGDLGVWTRSYRFGGGGWANTFLVRIGEGKLLIVSPPYKTPAAAMDEVAEWGEVVAVVAPNGFHHLGLSEWLDRFSGAKLYAPEPAAKRITKKYRDRALSFSSIESLASELPEHVRVLAPPHMKNPDVFACVQTERGAIWFSNDVLCNLRKLPKNWVLRTVIKLSRSGPGFTVNRLVVRFLGARRPEFPQWLRGQMTEYAPRILVPGHGDVLVGDDLGSRTLGVLDAAFA